MKADIMVACKAKQVRSIGGKPFKLYSSIPIYGSRAGAEEAAQYMRNRGNLVRVMPFNGGWVFYIRKRQRPE